MTIYELILTFLKRLLLIGSLTSKIIQGPIDVTIGTVVGLLWGCVLIFVPPSPWAMIYNKRESKVQITKKSEVNFTIIKQFVVLFFNFISTMIYLPIIGKI